MERTKRILFVTELAIFTALGIVFDYVCGLFGGISWANGGSVSIAMVPIFLMSYKHGLKGGLLIGLLVGSIQILWGYMVHPIQVLLDYTLAYGVLGLAGIAKRFFSENNLKNNIVIIVSILIVCFLRLICHVISGVVFYATPFWGSVAYNASFIILSTPLCIILTCILYRLLKNNYLK